MSNIILESLSRLEQSVDALEQAKKTPPAAVTPAAVPQNDLFGATQGASNVHTLDTAAFAKKLDSAIDKVEKLLREG